MIRIILASALLALSLNAPAGAAGIGDMTDTERQVFRDEVRAYLLENPEVLMEAIAVLEQRQARAQAGNDASLVQTNAQAIFDDGYSWVGGNPEGDVTLVEFMDYRCSYCRKAFDEVAQLVSEDGNIRFVVKEFPILGEQSLQAARFAIATKMVAGDTAYKQVHDALMTMRGNVTDASLTAMAERFDLEPGPIMKKMDSDAVNAIIRKNRELAQRLQISGTPTFVLEDRMLRGYVPLENMQQIVSDVRAD